MLCTSVSLCGMSTPGSNRAGLTPSPEGRPWRGSLAATLAGPAGVRSEATWGDPTGETPATSPVILPPAVHRQALAPSGAVALVPVYRALQVLTWSAGQLPLTVERGGRVLSGAEVPALIRRPSLEYTRTEFIEQCVTSLAVSGNLFIHKITGAGSETVALEVLPADHVTITYDRKRPIHRRARYHYDGTEYTPEQMIHETLFRMPGEPRGLGPIQAARNEISGAVDVRDYSAKWFSETGQPAGVLTTDQALSPEDAKATRNAWNRLNADGSPMDETANPSRVRVLSKGTHYEPLMLNPTDAQWLESRKFSVTEIARLFGIPSSLMLAPTDGTSMTYQNVEQEWIGYVRFTLMGYLRKIEEALSLDSITAHGQTVRFNVDALLRTDTKSRYDAHRIALSPDGFATLDEIRELEGLPPLTEAQRAEITARRTTAAARTQEIPAP